MKPDYFLLETDHLKPKFCNIGYQSPLVGDLGGFIFQSAAKICKYAVYAKMVEHIFLKGV